MLDLFDGRRGPGGSSRDRRPERHEHLGEARGELLGGRVDQHQPGDLVRVLVGEELDVETAQGMPDQHVGAGFAGGVEQGVKVVDDLLGSSLRGRVAAAAGGVGPVVAADSGEPGHDRLHRHPVGGDASLEHHGRAATAGAVEVERPPADVDAATSRGGRGRRLGQIEPGDAVRRGGLDREVGRAALPRGQGDEGDSPRRGRREGEARDGDGGVLRRGLPQQVEEDRGRQDVRQERRREVRGQLRLGQGRGTAVELGKDPGELLADGRSRELQRRCADLWRAGLSRGHRQRRQEQEQADEGHEQTAHGASFLRLVARDTAQDGRAATLTEGTPVHKPRLRCARPGLAMWSQGRRGEAAHATAGLARRQDAGSRGSDSEDETGEGAGQDQRPPT